MYPGHMWLGGGMFPWLSILVFFVLIILLAGGRWRISGSCREEPETPLEILKKRYARGEISREEFEQMKKDIS